MFNTITNLIISTLFLCACNNANNTKQAKKENLQNDSKDTVPVTQPAADSDEHGCNTLAGETWSIVMDSCVRLSLHGIKLDPQDAATDKTKPAWLIFTDDMTRVEIYLPTQKRSVIIRKSSGKGEPAKWTNGPLSLEESSGLYILYDESKILYQGTSAK